MTLPKDAELLGTNSEELEIKGSGAYTIVRFSADGRRKLVAGLTKTAGGSLSSRVYLLLENIRGANDASVLNVYINLPEDARPGEHRDLMAGAVGLYGLRRASIQSSQHGGSGLTFVLDVTPILGELLATKSLDADVIRVSIVPQRQLQESAGIVVARVSIVSIPAKRVD
jgi:tyrosinase